MKKNNKDYSDKVKKDNRVSHFDKNTMWIIEVTLTAFIMSLLLSRFSDVVIANTPVLVSLLVVFLFIALGILFDMIGVSATVADPKVFHSMASKKIKGSKVALKMIKDNSKVSSFCNDVIGDICGILSGGAGVTIAASLSSVYGFDLQLVTLIITSLIAALTIGGKACGKSFAINKANQILYGFSKFLSIFVR